MTRSWNELAKHHAARATTILDTLDRVGEDGSVEAEAFRAVPDREAAGALTAAATLALAHAAAALAYREALKS